MKFVAILVNFFLVIAIVVASLLIIADKTASASYLESVAQRTNSYQILSQIIPNQIALHADSDNPQQQQQTLHVLQNALTPDYLQDLITTTFDQFDGVIKGNKQQIVVDLSHIKNVAQSQGVAVSEDVFKPKIVNTDTLQNPIHIVRTVETVKFVALGCTIMLFLCSIFLGFWRRNYIGLGIALIVNGVVDLFLLTGLLIAPNMLISQIDFNKYGGDFTPLILSVIHRIVIDLRIQFAILSVIFLLIGILIIAFNKHLPHRSLPKSPLKPDSPKEPVSPQQAHGVDSIKPPSAHRPE